MFRFAASTEIVVAMNHCLFLNERFCFKNYCYWIYFKEPFVLIKARSQTELKIIIQL